MSEPKTNQPQKKADFSVRPAGRSCLLCGREMQAGELLTAVLIELPRGRRNEADAEFQRLDYCQECWGDSPWSDDGALLDEGQSAHPTDMYGAEPVAEWTGRVPERDKPKKTFIDDRVLTQFFLRLADDERPERQRFRFVLMLILMRHRKLRHAGTKRNRDGGDVWKVRLTPAMAEAVAADADAVHEVVDPQLGEAQVAEIASQLGQILQEDIDGDDAPGSE